MKTAEDIVLERYGTFASVVKLYEENQALRGRLNAMDIITLPCDAINPRVAKVFAEAEAKGWMLNPYASLVIRLTREDATPFYMQWNIDTDPATGKRSWRFQHARAANGQELNYGDVFVYLADPDVIEPQPPGE